MESADLRDVQQPTGGECSGWSSQADYWCQCAYDFPGLQASNTTMPCSSSSVCAPGMLLKAISMLSPARLQHISACAEMGASAKHAAHHLQRRICHPALTMPACLLQITFLKQAQSAFSKPQPQQPGEAPGPSYVETCRSVLAEAIANQAAAAPSSMGPSSAGATAEAAGCATAAAGAFSDRCTPAAAAPSRSGCASAAATADTQSACPRAGSCQCRVEGPGISNDTGPPAAATSAPAAVCHR